MLDYIRLEKANNYKIDYSIEDKEFDDILNLALSLTATSIAFIGFYSLDGLRIKSKRGFSSTTIHRETSLFKLISHDKNIVLQGFSKDDKSLLDSFSLDNFKIASYMSVPIYSNDAIAIGTLGVIENYSKEFSNSMLEGLITISRSITLLLENRLYKQQNSFIQMVTDFIPGMVGYWNSEMKCAFANKAYLEWFGKSRDTMLGLHIKEVLGETIFLKNEPFIKGALAGNIQRFERTIPKPDGSVGYTWAQYIPDIANGIVRGFIVLVTDVTELKQAEFSLKAAERKLNEILESMPEGLVEVNLSGEIVYANKGAGKILGINREEISGEYFNSTNWKQIDLNYEPYPLENLPIAIAMKEKKEVGPIEHGVVDSFDNTKWLSVHALPLVDKDNNLTGAIASFRDITERHEFQNRLIKAKEEADIANKAKSDFLANMSHEIRTPMNSILGFAEILNRKIKEEDLKEYAFSIMTSGKILLKLINDVLDLSKIEAGKYELNNSPVNLKRIFDEKKILFSQKLERKGLDFYIDIDKSMPEWLVLDETRLRQVLLNLIGNAVKFTDGGYIKLSAKVLEWDEAENTINLSLTIEDTGIGIPKDEQELIFEAFTQRLGQNNNEYGGTGLGLTIARKLTEMMNGRIIIESEISKGTRFTILLPDIEIFSENNFYGIEDKDYNEIYNLYNIKFSPAKILLVDDIGENRQIVKKYLEDFPELSIIEAVNGKIAVDRAKEFKPDLILMDIKMPVMNGVEAIHILKSMEGTKNIPIIALTASAFEQSKKEIRSICNGYLQKPVSSKNLIEKLLEFIEHTNSAKVEEEEFIDDFEPIDTIRLQSLSDIIQSKILQRIEDISSVIDINEIMIFSQEINTLGTEYGFKPFVIWSKKLEKSAQLFDANKIIFLLKDFHNIYLDLKNRVVSN